MRMRDPTSSTWLNKPQQADLCSAINRSGARLPPFPSDIHGADRRESVSKRHDSRRAACGGVGCPEPCLGAAPEFQVPRRNEAARDCNGRRTPYVRRLRKPDGADGDARNGAVHASEHQPGHQSIGRRQLRRERERSLARIVRCGESLYPIERWGPIRLCTGREASVEGSGQHAC